MPSNGASRPRSRVYARSSLSPVQRPRRSVSSRWCALAACAASPRSMTSTTCSARARCTASSRRGAGIARSLTRARFSIHTPFGLRPSTCERVSSIAASVGRAPGSPGDELSATRRLLTLIAATTLRRAIGLRPAGARRILPAGGGAHAIPSSLFPIMCPRCAKPRLRSARRMVRRSIRPPTRERTELLPSTRSCEDIWTAWRPHDPTRSCHDPALR